MTVELNLGEIAELLGLTRRQISNWRRDGVISGRPEGREVYVSGREAVRVYVEREIEKARKSWTSDERDTLAARKLAAEVAKAEHEAARIEGTTIEKADSEAAMAAFAIEVRTGLEKAPARFAAELLPDDPGRGRKVLEKIVREILSGMADVAPKNGKKSA